MTTTKQPPITGGPLLRKFKTKLPRRVAIALVIVLAGLMVVALVVPLLAAVLLVVLPACALFILGDSAVYWLKHRPTPRRYDDKDKLQPNKIEVLLLVMFALTPLWVRGALTDSDGLDFLFLIAGAFMAALYFLGKLALFHWWLPRKERSTTSPQHSHAKGHPTT